MFGKPFYRHLGNEYVSVCNYERIRIILPIIHLVKEEKCCTSQSSGVFLPNCSREASSKSYCHLHQIQKRIQCYKSAIFSVPKGTEQINKSSKLDKIIHDNFNILHMFNYRTCTDFRTANKHVLIPSYVIRVI